MRIIFFAILLVLSNHLYAQSAQSHNRQAPAASKYGDVCIKNAKPLKMPNLTYPQAAYKEGISGWAIVRYEIADGETTNIVLAESSAAIFNEPSLKATHDMKFSSDVSVKNCVIAFHFDTP